MPRSRYADEDTVACASCGQPIVWCYTRSGARMPCDPELLRIVVDDGGPHAGEVVAGRISHFATCPRADAHRKARAATPAPEPAPEPQPEPEAAPEAAPASAQAPVPSEPDGGSTAADGAALRARIEQVGLVIGQLGMAPLTETLHSATEAVEVRATMRRSGPAAKLSILWGDTRAAVTKAEARALGLL